MFSFPFFFFSFFLLWHCCEACGLFGPQPGVTPGPPGWECRVQDAGLPENSQDKGILISVHSPRSIHLDTKTQLHPTGCWIQSWTPHTKQPARQEHSPTHMQTGCLKWYEAHSHPKTHHMMWPCPSKGKDSVPPTSAQTPVSLTKKPTQTPGLTSHTSEQIKEARGTMTLQPARRRT